MIHLNASCRQKVQADPSVEFSTLFLWFPSAYPSFYFRKLRLPLAKIWSHSVFRERVKDIFFHLYFGFNIKTSMYPPSYSKYLGILHLSLALSSRIVGKHLPTYTKPKNVCFANNREFWKKGCRNTADKTQFTLQKNQNFRMLETLTGRK